MSLFTMLMTARYIVLCMGIGEIEFYAYQHMIWAVLLPIWIVLDHHIGLFIHSIFPPAEEATEEEI
jgi:hypothetical protein